VAFRMSLLPIEAQPFAAASFAVFLSIAAFAWGIWQTWLMCAVGLTVLYLRMAISAARAVGSDAANANSVEARPSGPLLQHGELARFLHVRKQPDYPVRIASGTTGAPSA